MSAVKRSFAATGNLHKDHFLIRSVIFWGGEWAISFFVTLLDLLFTLITRKRMADSLSVGHSSPVRYWSASCSSYCSLGTRWKEGRTGCPVFLSKFIVIEVVR